MKIDYDFLWKLENAIYLPEEVKTLFGNLESFNFRYNDVLLQSKL